MGPLEFGWGGFFGAALGLELAELEAAACFFIAAAAGFFIEAAAGIEDAEAVRFRPFRSTFSFFLVTSVVFFITWNSTISPFLIGLLIFLV